MPRKKLLSPWIERLDRTRPNAEVQENTIADVAIVGAGIAGVTTAYFLLTKTKKNVLLVESGRVAHGATGHNAGQITSYFERPFHDIAKEFGLTLAAEGQQSIDSAWDLLKEIRRVMRLTTPYYAFTGYAGCLDTAELVTQLKNNASKIAAGISTEAIFVADNLTDLPRLRRQFPDLFTEVPHQTILDRLETKDRRYIAALAGKKGCMNSAKFTEELVTALLTRYPKRFQLTELSPVTTLTLYRDHALLTTPQYTHTATRVVLCTNGFAHFTIKNYHGVDIDTKFHHAVQGSVGYMAAFIERPLGPPMAISYLPKSRADGNDTAYDATPYFYLTRRPHNSDPKAPEDLICIGGPEAHLDTNTQYKKMHPYPNEAKELLKTFVQRTYRHAEKRLQYAYLWHGLMGYTPNGIRCIGVEPCNPVLLYNLGCNGVGILPSLYGSSRIARLINGEKLSPSIFDPQDQRCMIPVAKTTRRFALPAKRLVGQQVVTAVIALWIIASVAVLSALPSLLH